MQRIPIADEELELHLMAGADHRMIDRLDRLWRLAHELLSARGVLGEDELVAAPGWSS